MIVAILLPSVLMLQINVYKRVAANARTLQGMLSKMEKGQADNKFENEFLKVEQEQGPVKQGSQMFRFKDILQIKAKVEWIDDPSRPPLEFDAFLFKPKPKEKKEQ